MPEAGLSAGMGSEPTETMCVMRLSASALGEIAASILGRVQSGRKSDADVPLQKGLSEGKRCEIHIRAQIELALDDRVDVPPDDP